MGIVNRYILQEWPDESSLELLESNLSNISKEKYEIISGKWDDPALDVSIKNLDQVDLLVMADCFYEKNNFPLLLSTISETFNSHPCLKKAVCIYHHRK